MREIMLQDLAIDVPFLWGYTDLKSMRNGCFLIHIKKVDTNKEYMCYIPPRIVNRGRENKVFIHKGDGKVCFLKRRNGLDYKFDEFFF